MTRGLGHFDMMAAFVGVVLAFAAFLSPPFGWVPDVLVPATLFAMVVWIAWQDARTFTIPDGALLVLALIGLALRVGAGALGSIPGDALLALLNAAICGGAFLALREIYFRRRGFDGLGFGDVKLAAAAGCLLGVEAFAWAVLIASLAMLSMVAVASFATPSRIVRRLPLGAFLAPVCWLLWMVRDQL